MGGMSWRFGAYELVLARRELRVAGEPRPLQPQVFAVLAYLVRNRHRVVPKEELLLALWPDAVVTDASLQRAVSLAHTIEVQGRFRLVVPDTVIEVAFDSIHPSDRHQSGFALRFPRIAEPRPTCPTGREARVVA